jgi:hypothetical protein
VIEMQMAEEDVDLRRRIVANLATERRKTRARVDDHKAAPALDLDAGSPPAEFRELGA